MFSYKHISQNIKKTKKKDKIVKDMYTDIFVRLTRFTVKQFTFEQQSRSFRKRN